MQLKLGKNPPVVDSRTLMMARYLTAELPPPPDEIDYGAKVPTWPMYLNDRYGDCTCAAAGHMIQAWTANAGKEVTVGDTSVLHFYEHFVGTPPPPDEGCVMLDVLNYWRKTGLARHKVRAFVALEPKNRQQAKDAVYLFAGLYLGVALPDFAVEGDMLAIPWEVPHGGPVGKAAPNQNNGHCIPAVAYDDHGLTIVTWGALKTMSWDFYDAYTDEAYAVLSQDFVAHNGKNVAGFDLKTLDADIAAIKHVQPVAG